MHRLMASDWHRPSSPRSSALGVKGSEGVRCLNLCSGSSHRKHVNCMDPSCAQQKVSQANASILLLIMAGGPAVEQTLQSSNRYIPRNVATALPAAQTCDNVHIVCAAYVDHDVPHVKAPAPGLTIVRPREYLATPEAQAPADCCNFSDRDGTPRLAMNGRHLDGSKSLVKRHGSM